MGLRVECECLLMIGPWRSNPIVQNPKETSFSSVDDVMPVSDIGEEIVNRIHLCLTLVEVAVIPSAEGQRHHRRWLFRLAVFAPPWVRWCASRSPLGVS